MPAAAQHRGDPGHELLEAERLHEVVVAAQGEAPHLVLGGVPSGEEQHRRAVAVWRSRLHTSKPSRSGSITSSTMRSGSTVGHRVDGVAPVGHRVHVEAGVAQRGLEHRAEVVLVVHEEEAGGGHPPSMASVPGRFL